MVEAALDFADQDIEFAPPPSVLEELRSLKSRLRVLAGSQAAPSPEAGAVEVAIAGLPNAGKSSLLNAIAGRTHAIVTPVAGTTRDAVTVTLEIEDICFRFVDTAGIAEFDAHLEDEAARRARRWIDSARIVLFLHDRTCDLGADELHLLDTLQPARTLLVLSKCDLPAHLSLESRLRLSQPWRVLSISARTRDGLPRLLQTLTDLVLEGRVDLSSQSPLVSLRQYQAARDALEALREAGDLVHAGRGYELVALALREASGHLGRITGEIAPEEILDRIFSRFCIGK
jgi:tRNA modification GTPase